MRRLKKIISMCLGAAAALALPAAAAGADTVYPSVIDPDRTGTVSIAYTDGAESQVPVCGAGFTLYKLADLTQTASGGRVSVYYEPVIDGITVNADADPAAILGTVQDAYAAGNVDGGKAYTFTTGEDGFAGIGGVAQGAYLAAETSPAEDYAASLPFIFTVPHTAYADNGTAAGWDYDVKAYPKASPLGRLKIEKTLTGNAAEPDREFHFTVIFNTEGAKPDAASGPANAAWWQKAFGTDSGQGSCGGAAYPFVRSDGVTGTIKSGGTLALKGGQSVTVSGIPAGTAYTVTEQEADSDGYATSVQGAAGRISHDAVRAASFVNSRSSTPTPTPESGTPTPTGGTGKPSVTPKPSSPASTRAGKAKTGDMSKPFFYAGLALCAVMVILIVMKNRRDDRE